MKKTLDFSLFSDFQRTLLEKISQADLTSVSIAAHDHAVVIERDLVLGEIEKTMQEKFSAEFLEKCFREECEILAEQSELFAVDQAGQLTLAAGQAADDSEEHDLRELLEQQRKAARKEGLRAYNLALRRQLEKILNQLQSKIVKQKKIELNIDYIPASIFGVAKYAGQSDSDQCLAKKNSDRPGL